MRSTTTVNGRLFLYLSVFLLALLPISSISAQANYISLSKSSFNNLSPAQQAVFYELA